MFFHSVFVFTLLQGTDNAHEFVDSQTSESESISAMSDKARHEALEASCIKWRIMWEDICAEIMPCAFQ